MLDKDKIRRLMKIQRRDRKSLFGLIEMVVSCGIEFMGD